MTPLRKTSRAWLALLVVLTLGLAACGGEDPTEDADDPAAAEGDTEAAEDPNEGTTPDTGAEPATDEGEGADDPQTSDFEYDEAFGEDDTAAFLEDPEAYVAERPTLVGTVEQVVSPYAFELGGDAWGDMTLLVIGTEEQVSQVSEGAPVSVTGELDQVDEGQVDAVAQTVEDAIGVTVDEQFLDPYVGDYLILAEEMFEGTESPTEG